MEDFLLTILRTHNPWLDAPRTQRERLEQRLPDPFIPRHARLELRPGQAELVLGPRQAGKSTWIVQSLSRVEDPVLILHAEEPRIRELCKSPALALSTLKPVLTPDTILLIEEAQHLDDAPLFIKGLVDLDRRRRIVVTGSSSLHLRARTRESLAGRARRTLLLPLSLAELSGRLDPSLTPAIRHQRLLDLWNDLQLHGGYPDPVTSEDPVPLLTRLVESFVLRDASDLHLIEHPPAFRKLLELAASDVGNLVNLSSWAGTAQVSRNTVAHYLEIARQVHVLRTVTPYAGGKRAEITGTPKVYFLDPGLRNALFGGFVPLADRADRGALWECTVFTEIVKHLDLLDQIHFWRSKGGAEVDFVVIRQGRIIGIEAKAGDPRDARPSRSARSFISAYRPHLFAVINRSLRQDASLDGVDVVFCRPWEIPRVLDGEIA